LAEYIILSWCSGRIVEKCRDCRWTAFKPNNGRDSVEILMFDCAQNVMFQIKFKQLKYHVNRSINFGFECSAKRSEEGKKKQVVQLKKWFRIPFT